MKTKDFNFDLPEHLIAQYPPENRSDSRLMVLERKTSRIIHTMFKNLPELLRDEKPLIVFNDTKVRKARITGVSEKDIKEDFLLLTQIEKNTTTWKAMVKHTKQKKIGSIYKFDNVKAKIANITLDRYVILEFDTPIDDAWLEQKGHVPLPPYIKRTDEVCEKFKDSERYQTIYAKKTGALAAPTAGLHFTKNILDELAAYGIEPVYITLHVGLGTFLPVRSENIEDHVMHEEEFCITEESAQKIEKAKNENRKIIATGTTSLRALESAAILEASSKTYKLKRGNQETSIFIYPGYDFKIADALITNFHTPCSTLLMLVSAFAGKELILKSYKEAIKNEYRFFSYGDAMLIR